MLRKVTSIAVTVAALAFAREASAQMATVAIQPANGSPPMVGSADEGVDRAGGIVNALLGFGARTGTGFGLGVEGGYTLPMHLYLGGMFTYFVGSSDVSAYLFEPQVGYDLGVIKAAPVLIRPYLGLGYESFSVGGVNCTVNGVNVCAGTTFGGGGFVLSPGVMGAYFFTPHWFAGLDIRFDIAASGYTGVTADFAATGGYKF